MSETDLKSIRTQLKTWERAFKAENGRNPAKEDIKTRPDIAEKYKLYRDLSSKSDTSKVVQPSRKSTPPPPPPPHSHSSSSRNNSGLPSTSSSSLPIAPSSPSSSATARPLFQTPVKPKPSGHLSSTPIGAPTSRTLQSPSHNPFLSPSASSSSRRPPASIPRSPFARPKSQAEKKESSFLYISTPKRLQQVLQAASAEQRANGGSGTNKREDITPRTRARKRLRGEDVDDTPGKQKAPRLSLGRRPVAGNTSGRDGSLDIVNGSATRESNGSLGSHKRLGMPSRSNSSRAVTPESSDTEEEEETFGPTPMKPNSNRKFTGLFEQVGKDKAGVVEESSDGDEKEGDEQGILKRNGLKGRTLFRPMKDDGIGNEHGKTIAPVHDSFLARSRRLKTPNAQAGVLSAQASLFSDKKSLNGDILRTQAVDEEEDEEDEEAEEEEEEEDGDISGDHESSHAFSEGDPDELPSPSPSTTVTPDDPDLLDGLSSAILPKVEEYEQRSVEWSSEDEDDFDDDGEDRRRIHRIKVEPYRAGLQRRLDKAKAKDLEEERNKDDNREASSNEEDNIEHDHEQTTAISQLTLASPEAKIALRTRRLHEARARAIFDRNAASRLKASKGIPVWLPGEMEGDDDGRVDENGDEDGQGWEEDKDEDWDSEPEGWKAVGLPDDDDW